MQARHRLRIKEPWRHPRGGDADTAGLPEPHLAGHGGDVTTWDSWGDLSSPIRGELDETLGLSRNLNRELAHLLVGIAARSAGLQRQLPDRTEAELAAYSAATDRIEPRLRSLLGPSGSKVSGTPL